MLATGASALTFAELPDDVVELATQALLDWFGVTLGASREDVTEILLAALPSVAAGRPDSASVVGRSQRLSVRDAALVNGTASHRLDFDDVNAGFLGHASVAVIAAALSLGEDLDLDGQALIAAFVAGYETACRVALALGPQPYVRGFHSTGTVGTLGAAAACSRLLGLDGTQATMALGIAASEAAGLKANFGTMTKSLHAGKACENGLLAALLAARGFTSNPQAIEGEQGLAAVSGGACDVAAALADPPSGWHLRENLFKYHAACYWAHSAIEGVRELRDRHTLQAGDVERVRLHVSDLELGTCANPAPRNGLEVKFSLAHLVAMVLLGIDTTVIDDRVAGDPGAVELRARVELVADGVAGTPTRVELLLRDGRTLEGAVDVNTPERDGMRQRRRLEAKFAALAEPVLGEEGARRLRAQIDGLRDGGGLRTLMEAARRDG